MRARMYVWIYIGVGGGRCLMTHFYTLILCVLISGCLFLFFNLV